MISSLISLVNILLLSKVFGREEIKKSKSKFVSIFSFLMLDFLMSSFNMSYDVNGTDENTSEKEAVMSSYLDVFILGTLK